MVKVEKRGYTATKTGNKIRIYDWNNELVAIDSDELYIGSDEDMASQAIDRFIGLAPYRKMGFFSDGKSRAVAL